MEGNFYTVSRGLPRNGGFRRAWKDWGVGQKGLFSLPDFSLGKFMFFLVLGVKPR